MRRRTHTQKRKLEISHYLIKTTGSRDGKDFQIASRSYTVTKLHENSHHMFNIEEKPQTASTTKKRETTRGKRDAFLLLSVWFELDSLQNSASAFSSADSRVITSCCAEICLDFTRTRCLRSKPTTLITANPWIQQTQYRKRFVDCTGEVKWLAAHWVWDIAQERWRS